VSGQSIKLIQVYVENIQLVNSFIQRGGSSLKTFRYFSKRPLSIVKHHVCTWVIEKGGQVEAYGHLDREDGVVWLGIAVTESARGRGLGRRMMQRLMESASLNEIRYLKLSVDKTNVNAIKLYEHFGFRLLSEIGSVRYYEWKIDPRTQV
jgi:ribosomal protein S18 acetylase RimI-like enzyme